MNCPHCNSELKLKERQGIQITFCAQCRGVWLDHEGLIKVLQHYTAERLSVMKRYDELSSARDPEFDMPAEFESLEERRRHEMRRLEELNFDPNYEQLPRGKGGILNDIFNLFD